jgi:3-phenylpropionate/cinnamic acid dioxygenase small subunit
MSCGGFPTRPWRAPVPAEVRVDPALAYEVEQFLYDEAALLDERRFHEWIELFTEDAHYWMPIRSTRARGQEDLELTAEHENSYFDEDRSMLEQRVAKLDTGWSWAEDPPSRTRHLVSNVRLRPREDPDELTVLCNFVVYRSRLAVDEDLWVGRREDVLRRIDGGWKIARRHIYLDQTVLQSKNLSSFF